MLRSVVVAALIAVSGSLVSQVAHAFPLTSTKPWRQNYSVEISSTFSFNGITALSNCSASYVKFKGASEDSKALILTNGHCTGGYFGGMLKPGEIYDRKARSFNVTLLDPNAQRIASLRSELILYATMTNTDVALLELTQTYRQIKAQTGVDPLEMSDQRPNVGIDIEVPSGYWKRTYRCRIDGFVETLREASWTFRDSVRYSASGCEVIGGTSGSPIVSPVSGEVVAINNTGNEDGQMCTLNNPCEVDPQGNQVVLKGRGYGQQTYWLYSCLTSDKNFDLKTPGCVLPKGKIN